MIRKQLRKLEARSVVAIGSLLSLTIIGTVVYHYLEDWSWGESFYFTVVTLATVGYGDLHPTNYASRLFTAVFILLGVTVALAALTVIGTGYLSRRGERVEKRRSDR